MKPFCTLLVVLGMLLPACSLPAGRRSASTAAAQTSPPPITQPAQTPEVLPSPAPSAEPVVLRLWVPPQFDPDSGTPAGNLLRARLNEFSKSRPQVERIDVRVKAVDGPGGLFDALSTAGAAAPGVLPDVVALPRNLLEQAALKGLLQPHPALAHEMGSADWYPYAQDLSRLQGTVYGLPFAGDALALVYRPQASPAKPPDTWQALEQGSSTLAFPAADPLASFTLASYQAAGGPMTNDQGRPVLDPLVLTQVLTYYVASERAGVMPAWLAQIQADDQTWEALKDGRANLAVTWTSRYLSEETGDMGLAPLPTPDGGAHTLATGWVWALTGRGAERQELAADLTAFLAEPSFLESWWQTANLLPVRAGFSARDVASETARAIDQIAGSAGLLPAMEVQMALGQALQQAVVQVLKQQATPYDASQAAARGLTGP